MNTLLKAITVCFLGLSITLVPMQKSYALASAADLGFDGASVNGFAQGGGFVYASVNGPKGVFVSNNFGNSWQFAAGGSYSSGRGVDLLASSSRIFAILGEQVFYSDFSLTPSWQVLDLNFSAASSSGAFTVAEKPNALASDGTFLFVSSSYGKIRSVLLSTLALLDTSTLPDVTEPVRVPKLTSNGANALFAFKKVPGSGPGTLYRATYNPSSGVISTWNEKNVGSIGSGGKFAAVFGNGSGIIYVVFSNANGSTQGLLRSDDGGDSFQNITSQLPSGIKAKLLGAAFRGSTHIIGGLISSDDGENFEKLPFPTTSTGASLDGLATLVDANDSKKVMGTSPIGPLVTTDADQAGSSSWTPKISGLRGAAINDMAQSADLAVTVLALNTGIARSKNFSTSSISANAVPTYSYPIVPEIAGEKVIEAIHAVAIDPDNANVVYVGGSKLYKVTFDSLNNPTWQIIHTPSPSTLAISDIAVAGTKFVVSFLQVEEALDGKVMIFDRTSLVEQSTALSGSPVRALTALNASVIYAGVGGLATELTEDAATDRGLFRSSNGGASWTKISTDTSLTFAAVKGLAYDFFGDVLYVAGNGFKTGPGSKEIGLGSRDESGNVFILKKASKSKPTVMLPIAGIDTTQKISAIALATKDGTQKVYAAQGGKVLESNGKGEAWALLFEGLADDETSLLFFDDLVQNTDSGFNSLAGSPNLVISSITAKISALTAKKIEVKVSKELVDSASNRKKIRARLSGTALKIAKKNETALLVLPRGKWPSNGTVKITVRADLQAKDGESIDSDYDGTQGGSALTRKVKIAQ